MLRPIARRVERADIAREAWPGGLDELHDLVGLAVGSEGTFGVVTRAWVRLLTLPPETVTFLAPYESIEAAGEAVSALVANGVTPAALELILREGGGRPADPAALRAAAAQRPDLRALLAFAASDVHFALRQRLRVAIA